MSPAASRISTAGPSILARAVTARVSSNTPRIEAAAASLWPCASRSSDNPGCGFRPRSLARAYVSSAFANSPRRRWILSEPVECGTRGRSGHQQPTRGLRILRRIIPSATQLQDLGAIEQALAAVAHQIRSTGTPLCERHGPLERPTQIEDLLAGLKHAAVDVTCQDGRYVARHHGGHRLIEQRNALRNDSEVNECTSAPVARQ